MYILNRWARKSGFLAIYSISLRTTVILVAIYLNMALTVISRSAYVIFRPQIARYCTQRVNNVLGNSPSLGTESKNADVKCAILDHRKIVEIKGRDTSEFLQGVITNDITFLPEMKSMYAMLLHQNGRIMYDLILYQHLYDEESKIFMECDAELVTNLVKNLKLYKIRKKVTITPADDKTVMHFFKRNPSKENVEQPDVIGSMARKSDIITTADPRLPYFGHRVIVETSDVINSTEIVNDIEGYHACRIELGIPEGGIDLPPGKCLPLECNLDYMNGVSFHKGCYVGQELTARTKFTGVIRKRLMPITISYTDLSSQDVIEPNTPLLTKSGKKAGKIQSIYAGRDMGLALIRLNYAKETLFTKSGHVINCNIPSWWPCEDGTKFSNGICGPQ